MEGLLAFPDEVLTLLLSHLRLRDVPSAACCKRLHAVLFAPGEAVWRSHLVRMMDLEEDTTARCGSSWRDMVRAYVAQPSALCISCDNSHHLVCEGLTARFTGRLGRDRALRADVPIPMGDGYVGLRTTVDQASSGLRQRRRCELTSLFYYEVAIAAAPLAGGAGDASGHLAPCVSVGLATHDFSLRNKQTGWDRFSLGYHGDDGLLYHGHGGGLRVTHRATSVVDGTVRHDRVEGGRYGPAFASGDTVGCGVHLRSRRVFFTLNGRYLGPAFSLKDSLEGEAGLQLPGPSPLSASVEVYAAVGIDSHQSVALNFGEQPFAFDMDAEVWPHSIAHTLGTQVARCDAIAELGGTGALPERGGLLPQLPVARLAFSAISARVLHSAAAGGAESGDPVGMLNFWGLADPDSAGLDSDHSGDESGGGDDDDEDGSHGTDSGSDSGGDEGDENGGGETDNGSDSGSGDGSGGGGGEEAEARE